MLNVDLKKAYTTHMGILVKVLSISEGDVIELGTGPFSTPLLHWICKDMGRKLISYETDPDYYNYARQYRSPLHRIRQVPNWDEVDATTHRGVVFIDHNPVERRAIDTIRFKDSADYILIHDTSNVNYFSSIWLHFKYSFTWKECHPWVSVVSNFKDLSLFQKEIDLNINYDVITELCKLGYKYGTDKSPLVGHSYYTSFYYELLKDKKKVFKKILELGIGTGASLRMWRDFFPNAQIYGVDLSPATIFQDERIQTYLLNTKDETAMRKLIQEIGSDIDLVVDDGTHREKSQVRAVRALMPVLKNDVIYIIEDVYDAESIKKELREYNCEIGLTGPKKAANLIIVKRK